MKRLSVIVVGLIMGAALHGNASQNTETNKVLEISFQTQAPYANSFTDVDLDVVFTKPDGPYLEEEICQNADSSKVYLSANQ